MSLIVLTRKWLDQNGLIVNPNMWLGNGWLYCAICREYTYHYAMSHSGQHDCYEVCKQCDAYSGRKIN